MADGKEEKEDQLLKTILLLINCTMLATGICGGALVMRLYFIHGGNRVWLSSFLETAGFPVMLFPLTISYICRRRRSLTTISEGTKLKMVYMKPPLFAASAFVGILTGLDDYLYASGVAKLPVSTSSLILATHLAFTAVFAFILVRQKFTAYSVNAVVLISLSAGVLAMHTNGDRPAGESTKQYVMGFLMTLVAAALYGFVLPFVELIYKKTKQPITYSLVMEIQLVMCFFATLFCIVGMIINNDFKVIPKEAKNFELGESKYYFVLVGSAIMWQFFFLGAIGVVFCASSLLTAIITATMLPVTEILAVIFYKEMFRAEKGVSLFLSLWGFVSYFYGEIKHAKKTKNNGIPEIELPQRVTTITDP